MSFDEYRRRYVEPIATSVGRARREPAWEAHWLTPPPAGARPPSARFFLRGRNRVRAPSSVEGLRRYAFDPDSLHAATDSRVRELIEALERERAKVQPVDCARHARRRGHCAISRGGCAAEALALFSWAFTELRG
jgi:hypothetical protein